MTIKNGRDWMFDIENIDFMRDIKKTRDTKKIEKYFLEKYIFWLY